MNQGTCSVCSGITNASGTTTVAGKCDCATNFFWKNNSCQACPSSGCPKNNNSEDKQKNPTPNGGRGNLRNDLPQGQGQQQGGQEQGGQRGGRGGRNW